MMNQVSGLSQCKTNFVDAHSHLADERMRDFIDEVIERSRARGAEKFIQAGVGPEDWHAQEKLAHRFPGVVIPCFGLHPYWVSSHTDEDCSRALIELEVRLEKSIALGECGLDFRRLIVADREQRQQSQIRFFHEQLELARRYQKAVVFHFVRCHEIALKLLRVFGRLPRESVVHSFTASPEVARGYLDLDVSFSIGAAVLCADAHRLHASLREIPLERILLESDSPDQPPPGFAGEYNEPWIIVDVAAQIAKIKGVGLEKVFEICRSNTERVFGV
jgi:TatD DNase family protein